jgi:hypothetical protein
MSSRHAREDGAAEAEERDMGTRSSSDRRIVAARRVDDLATAKTAVRAVLEEPRGREDTWPAPPPSSASLDDASLDEPALDRTGEPSQHDTIPTPPPESGVADVLVIPPLRGVLIESDGEER